MSTTALKRWWTADASRDGMQLMVAVVAAYLASTALGLPESLWAVMSVLIVVRPTTGSTVGAGWDRIRGVAVGSACALAGVWARHRLGVEVQWFTLGVVALLAFASATRPAMRSAPITALIVLNSSGIAGLSALHVALLRTIEVGIGVIVGMAVSALGPHSRAAARFDAACAALLREMASDLQATSDGSARDEATAARSRAALRRLAELGMSADREERLFRRGRTKGVDRQRHVTAARLMARMAHDVAVFGRLRSMSGSAHQAANDAANNGVQNDDAWPRFWQDLQAALTSTADTLASGTPHDLSMLKRPTPPALASTGPALRLLRQDLVGLVRLRGTADVDR